MEHFVTLFDSLYLPQGLALHKSMLRNIDSFILWVLCVDEQACDALEKLNLCNVKILKLFELETEELLCVKQQRTRGEYCWTLTPFAPKFVFQADPSIKRVTYLDADLWFRRSPAPIFELFDKSGGGVLLTDHSFSPEFDQSSIAGQYCVQFLVFDRENGEIVRSDWEGKCLDWCFAKPEDGKFGDQKYLDEWPSKYKNIIYILLNKELILAPWNATRFPYGNSIAWHFQGLRIVRQAFGRVNYKIILSNYPIPRPTIGHIYAPYLVDLKQAILDLKEIGVNIRLQSPPPLIDRLVSVFKGLHQMIWRLNFSPSKWI